MIGFRGDPVADAPPGVSARSGGVLKRDQWQGLTYNVSAPLVLEATLLPVSGIAISAAPVWTSSDIGAVGAAGSLTEDHGTFIVGGAGADIGPAAGDEFRSVRQDFTGGRSAPGNRPCWWCRATSRGAAASRC